MYQGKSMSYEFITFKPHSVSKDIGPQPTGSQTWHGKRKLHRPGSGSWR